MPPRLQVCLRCLRSAKPTSFLISIPASSHAARHASASAAHATTPAPPIEQMTHASSPIILHPASQPPSHRRPEVRRSQLHRQYTSMLRATPLMLLLQHGNLTAVEWMALRRELAIALRGVDTRLRASDPESVELADAIKLQVVHTGVFGHAVRVVEFFKPESAEAQTIHPTDPRTRGSAPILDAASGSKHDLVYTHDLSAAAHDAASRSKAQSPLEPLLAGGPVAVLTFPAVAPAHLKAALQVISPLAPGFPAPSKRVQPGYWVPEVQAATKKLILLGVRVEGKVMGGEGARWVGGMEGGKEGLRAELVHILQGVSGGIVRALETASRGVYFTLEGRREALEGEGKKDAEPSKEAEVAKEAEVKKE